jgi:lipoprotein-anchoring transpeptidase ErfK/SrfK
MKPYLNVAQNGIVYTVNRPQLTPLVPAKATFNNDFRPGTVVVDTAGRQLYFTLSSTEAYVYPVAVGKPGFAWTGAQTVSRISNWPDWVPPAEMRQRKPSLPERMLGGIDNPLGAQAIYLGDTLYRIHGTNNPASIGTASSSGCIRMRNEHVVHLSGLLSKGTKVFILEQLPASARIMVPTETASATIIGATVAEAISVTPSLKPVQVALR